MNLVYARLTYGSVRVYTVTHEHLPQVFDFENPVECAKKVFAVMSNASGGHLIRNCRLTMDPQTKRASLVASGVNVLYEDPTVPKVSIKTVEQALAYVDDMLKNQTVTHLGSVSTTQYADGWRKAVWIS